MCNLLSKRDIFKPKKGLINNYTSEHALGLTQTIKIHTCLLFNITFPHFIYSGLYSWKLCWDQLCAFTNHTEINMLVYVPHVTVWQFLRNVYLGVAGSEMYIWLICLTKQVLQNNFGCVNFINSAFSDSHIPTTLEIRQLFRFCQSNRFKGIFNVLWIWISLYNNEFEFASFWGFSSTKMPVNGFVTFLCFILICGNSRYSFLIGDRLQASLNLSLLLLLVLHIVSLIE